MSEATAIPAAWADIRSKLATIVGAENVLSDPRETQPYCEDWRQMYKGKTPAVVRPASAKEVAEVVRRCSEWRIAIVPQGGNTGLVNGGTPASSGDEIVLSLGRMNKVRDLDDVNMTLTVESGVTLKAAQDAALARDCMLPLSMGSEGSAQIGGVLSTNAGGNHTVRYGNARDRVLGLEVVLPDGAIWNGLRRLRKDNTGYCLRQLFVGAEGTLGVITAAVLKLVPRPQSVEVALCAVASEKAALDLFLSCRAQHHDSIQAFEYMFGAGMELILQHIPETHFPLAKSSPHYVLIEFAGDFRGSALREKLEDFLGSAMDANLIQDAALAGSSSERAALWRLREEQSEAQKREAASIKNDVSVPVSKVADFLVRAREQCDRSFPGIRVIPYGHMGDGNIHFNLLPARGTSNAEFMAQSESIMNVVNEVVRNFDGSFSAEHGIGRAKSYLMEEWRGGPELETMRRIKAALDPLGIMNPGKVFPNRANHP